MTIATDDAAGGGTVESIHLDARGTGPALLMLHGIGGSADSFEPQFAGIEGLRLIAWDAPGYGRSADSDEGLDLDGYADAAASIIRAECGDDGAHVLGMSWGGVIATRLALRHPDLVRCLILGSSSVGSGADAAAAERMRARGGDLRVQGAEAYSAERTPRLLADDAPAELVGPAQRNMARTIRLPGYAHAAASMAATDHTADLAHVTAPTLVLCGDRDEVTGRAAGQVLAGAIPDGVFVTVRGGGHLINQERPDAVNAWVESFVHIAEKLRVLS